MLTDKQKTALENWLESMPWWSELRYVEELERCRKLAHEYITAYEKLAFGEENASENVETN